MYWRGIFKSFRKEIWITITVELLKSTSGCQCQKPFVILIGLTKIGSAHKKSLTRKRFSFPSLDPLKSTAQAANAKKPFVILIGLTKIGSAHMKSKYVGVSLVGKTLAVMGFGKVGSEVGRHAKGLGMHVIAHDPYVLADRARAIGVDLISFEQAIGTADFISLHMPLTPATNKVFNNDTFTEINFARGGVIDENALVRSLDSEIVAQAALDVFTVKPPSKYSKLVQHENVTVTPHLGAITKEAKEGVATEIAESVVGALNGELSAIAVNAPMVFTELAPYVMLAEKLGGLAVQLVTGGSGIQTVKVVYKSARFQCKAEGLRIIVD